MIIGKKDITYVADMKADNFAMHRKWDGHVCTASAHQQVSELAQVSRMLQKLRRAIPVSMVDPRRLVSEAITDIEGLLYRIKGS